MSRTRSEKLSLSFLILLIAVFCIGSLKMLAESKSIQMTLTITEPSGPTYPPVTPPAPPVTPPATPEEPVIPIVQPIPSPLPTIDEIKVVPTTPTPGVEQPEFQIETINKYGQIEAKMLLTLKYKLLLLFLLALILANLFLLWLLFVPPSRIRNTVFDSVTADPIEGAKIVVLDSKGKTIQTTETNSSGHFILNTNLILKKLKPPTAIAIKVSKANYIFPSKHLKGKERFGSYRNLYFGGNILIESKKDLLELHINVPMDEK